MLAFGVLLAQQWFFVPAGLVIGLVFHASLVAAAVWTVQLGLVRGLRASAVVVLALALAQLLLATPAFLLVFNLGRWGQLLDPSLRLASVAGLLVMAWQVRAAPRLEKLRLDEELDGGKRLFVGTFRSALRMWPRFAGYFAVACTMGVHLRSPGSAAAILAAVGVGLAGLLWWGYFALLTALFGRRVPEPITLRSLNKLRVLAFTVLLGFALICAIPLAVDFE